MGISLDEAGRRIGWTRGVFCATLRRLEARGGDCTRETYEKIAGVIDRPVWWILWGEMGRPDGARLADNASWPAESAEASTRYSVSAEALLTIGEVGTPEPLRRLSAGLIVMLADAMWEPGDPVRSRRPRGCRGDRGQHQEGCPPGALGGPIDGGPKLAGRCV